MSRPTGEHDRRDESFAALVKDLSQDTATLVRQEVALARAELTQKGKAAGKGAGLLAGAAVMGLATLGALTAFVIIILDLALPLWLAALLTTLLWGAVAGALAASGRTELKRGLPPTPEQTVETVKEDVQWAKTQTRSAGR